MFHCNTGAHRRKKCRSWYCKKENTWNIWNEWNTRALRQIIPGFNKPIPQTKQWTKKICANTVLFIITPHFFELYLARVLFTIFATTFTQDTRITAFSATTRKTRTNDINMYLVTLVGFSILGRQFDLRYEYMVITKNIVMFTVNLLLTSTTQNTNDAKDPELMSEGGNWN